MISRVFFLVLFFSLLFLHAHDVRPAKLDVDQLNDSTYLLLLKIPANSKFKNKMGVEVDLPCYVKSEIQKDSGVFFIKKYIVVTNDKESLNFRISGIKKALFNVFFTINYLNKEKKVGQLSSKDNSFSSKQSVVNGFFGYVLLGIEHIAGGIDHLMFVLCLLLLISTRKKLFQVITAFTVAHSITLFSSLSDNALLPSTVVEFMILLSLIFLAREVILSRPTLTTRYPAIMAFLLGLVHGMGFASVLRSVDLPTDYILQALLAFNIGIEVGQILFICCIYIFFFIIYKTLGDAARKLIKKNTPFMVGGYAVFLIFQMLFF